MSDEGPTYQVTYLPSFLQQVRQMGDRAAVLGLRLEFAALLRTIHGSLTTKPVEWGDPFKRIPTTGTVLYRRLLETVSVIYAVNEQRRLVVVKEIRTQTGSPYSEPE
jgi:hypothetical protein